MVIGVEVYSVSRVHITTKTVWIHSAHLLYENAGLGIFFI